jgi:phage virion morphogenesis protein
MTKIAQNIIYATCPKKGGHLTLNALSRLQRKTGNLRPVMQDISETLKNSVEENFAQESARNPIGGEKRGAWDDLAPSTLQSRARANKSGKKLQFTGVLLGSIQTKANNNEAMVGTNNEYARFLNDGTKKMPARPFMVVQREDVDEIRETLEEYLRS